METPASLGLGLWVTFKLHWAELKTLRVRSIDHGSVDILHVSMIMQVVLYVRSTSSAAH